MFDQEEEAFKILLSRKFELFKRLIQGTLEHEHEPARITVEQARRMAVYVHETYFRHLRLYDFVLKNTKLSEVKRVTIPIAEPNCGEGLNKAMVLMDETTLAAGGSGASDGMGRVGPSGMQSIGAAGGLSGAMESGQFASQDGTVGKGGDVTLGTDLNEDSVTDTDMDSAIKTVPMDRKARNVMHRVTKGWNEKITSAAAREVDETII